MTFLLYFSFQFESCYTKLSLKYQIIHNILLQVASVTLSFQGFSKSIKTMLLFALQFVFPNQYSEKVSFLLNIWFLKRQQSIYWSLLKSKGKVDRSTNVRRRYIFFIRIFASSHNPNPVVMNVICWNFNQYKPIILIYIL